MNEAHSANQPADAIPLRVGGLARLSTCDWPGELVTTVFCQGCAWDCGYCHNPHLRPLQCDSPLEWRDVMEFLKRRRGLLDAVVFSGGEPTLQHALVDAVRSVKSLGFRVGLHTGGMAPQSFASLLPLVDWVGFDVKAPFPAYARITGVEGSGEPSLASLKMLLASSVAYEVRTTVHPAMLSLDEVVQLRDELLSLGVTHYAIQHFRSTGTVPNRLAALAEEQEMQIPAHFGQEFRSFTVR